MSPHWYFAVFYVVSLPKHGAYRIILPHCRDPLSVNVYPLDVAKMVKPESTVDLQQPTRARHAIAGFFK